MVLKKRVSFHRSPEPSSLADSCLLSLPRSGFTLVENLASIFLLSIVMLSILGAFFISQMSTSRDRHRLAAMHVLNDYIERELKEGYDGGSGGEQDYYATVTSEDGAYEPIDDKGTEDESDDLMAHIRPDPYFPDNVENADGSFISQNGVPYKIIGFEITWSEGIGGGNCRERAVVYAALHTS